jgi:hypothetical protein
MDLFTYKRLEKLKELAQTVVDKDKTVVTSLAFTSDPDEGGFFELNVGVCENLVTFRVRQRGSGESSDVASNADMENILRMFSMAEAWLERHAKEQRLLSMARAAMEDSGEDIPRH